MTEDKRLKDTIRKSVRQVLSEESINAKKRNTKNVEDAFRKGKRGYNSIRTMGVFTAENPNSQPAPKGVNKKNNKHLQQALRDARYVVIKAEGKFGSVEHPYVVLNITPDTMAWYCGKYEQTSFIYHILNADGTIHSEYWEKSNPSESYDEQENPYVKKDESDEWVDMGGADDYYTIVGKDFKYQIPFPTLCEADNVITENLDRLMNKRRRNGLNESRDGLLGFSMGSVGMSGCLYRGALNKGLL